MPVRRALACLLCVFVFAACESDSQPGVTPAAAPPDTPAQAAADEAAEPMPKALRAAYVQAVQRDASPAYTARADGDRIVAENAAQGLDAAFAHDAVVVSPQDGAWRFGLKLERVDGRDVAPARPRVTGNRVEYDRGAGVTEWWLNGPLGLEQGFTISEAAGDEVVIALESFGGLTLADSSSDAVSWDLGEGRRLRYAELHAWDAEGEPLEAVMHAEGDELRLVVDVRGARWPVVVDPLVALETKLTASDGAASDWFGRGVALDGSTAIVGAPSHDAAAFNAGAAYVFVYDGANWTHQQTLTANDAAGSESFGYAVALSGDTALIGAFYDNVGTYTNSGSAYVFVRSGTTWSQQAKLTASDGRTDDWFGVSVAIDGDSAVVGARGALSGRGQAYAFERTGTTWAEVSRMVGVGGVAGDGFGSSVAIDGNLIVIGAPSVATGLGDHVGAAYVFERMPGPVWGQYAMLGASDAAASQSFGRAVAVDGTTLVASGGSAAYVFVRSGTTWSQQQKLASSTGVGAFGARLDLEGDLLFVGAPGEDSNQGAVYFFGRSGTSWTQLARLVASDRAADDQAGYSLALSGDLAVVGAHLDDDRGSDAGSVYFFDLVPDLAPSDLALSQATVTENAATDTLVGTLTTTDTRFDTHTYQLTGDAGGRFAIAGDELRVADGTLLDFEAAASHDVTVRSTDLNGLSLDRTFTITVTDLDEPPTAASATQTLDEDTPTILELQVSDPDAQDTPGIQITTPPANGMLTGTFPMVRYTPRANFHGTDSLTFIATDGALTSAPATLSLTITSVDDAPVLEAPAPDAVFDAQQGMPLMLALSASDVEGAPLTYGVQPLPAGATLDATSGMFAWNPSAEQLGAHVLALSVSDGTLTDGHNITVRVGGDSDGDGLSDILEEELGLDPDGRDSDSDTIADADELGDPTAPTDSDDDGTLDALDSDSDADTISDRDEAGDTDLDTPPLDTDEDGTPDFQDADSDDDTLADSFDNCRLTPNPTQEDTDQDGSGDACDTDQTEPGDDVVAGDDVAEADAGEGSGGDDGGCGCRTVATAPTTPMRPLGVLIAALFLAGIVLRRRIGA